jgi:hypothetical protein
MAVICDEYFCHFWLIRKQLRVPLNPATDSEGPEIQGLSELPSA